jgi:hypothetical protein
MQLAGDFYSNTLYYRSTNGSGTTAWNKIWHDGNFTGGGLTVSDDTTTNASYYPIIATATSGSQSAGKVSSTKLYFNPSTGTLNATIFNSLSDISKKTNIVKINDATETINKIVGVEFNWIDNNTKSAGVIAQELEKILPHLVAETDGIKSVSYSGLIAYLIESNKELHARICILESK